jgi:hypothetical protein
VAALSIGYLSSPPKQLLDDRIVEEERDQKVQSTQDLSYAENSADLPVFI